MGGVILAFSQLIAYSWLKFLLRSASWMLLIAGNSPVSTLLTEICLAVAVLRRRVVWLAIPMFAAFVANSIGGKLAFPLVLSAA